MSDRKPDSELERVPASKHKLLRSLVAAAAFTIPVVAATGGCAGGPKCPPGVPCPVS